MYTKYAYVYVVYALHIYIYMNNYIHTILLCLHIPLMVLWVLTIKESSQSLEFPILQIRSGAPNGLTRWHWKGKKSPTVPHPEMVCWGSSKKTSVELLMGFKSKKKPKRKFEVRDIETSHSLFLCNHETNLGSFCLQPSEWIIIILVGPKSWKIS